MPEADSGARIHRQVVYLGGDSEINRKWNGEMRQRSSQALSTTAGNELVSLENSVEDKFWSYPTKGIRVFSR